MRTGDAGAAERARAAARCSRASATSAQRGRALWVDRCAQDDLGQQGRERTRGRRGAGDRAAMRRPVGRGLGAQHPLAPAHRPREAPARAASGARRLPGVGSRLGSGGDLQQPRARLSRAWACIGARAAWRSRPMAIRRRLHDYSSVAERADDPRRQRSFVGNAAIGAHAPRRARGRRSLPGANSDGVWALGLDWLVRHDRHRGARRRRRGARSSSSACAGCEPMPETSFQILALTDLCTAHLLRGRRGGGARGVAPSDRPATAHAKVASIGCGSVARARVVVAPPGAGGARRAPGEAQTRRCKHAYALLLEGIGTSERRGPAPQLPQQDRLAPRDRRARGSSTRATAAPVAKRRAAHLAGEADLRRAVRAPGRHRHAPERAAQRRAELHEFLVDEVTELARRRARAAGAGDADRGSPSRRLAAAHGRGRARAAAAVAPWLDEARRNRADEPAPRARRRRRARPALDLVAPLIAQQRLLGYLYADIDGAFGRFHDADRDLLGMLAAQAAVALDNAQWSQGLEAKVAERTAELEASNARSSSAPASSRSSTASSRGWRPSSTSRRSSTSSATRSARSTIRPTSASGSTIRRRSSIHFPYIYEDGKRIEIDSPTRSRTRLRAARPAHARDARHQRQHGGDHGEVRQLHDTRHDSPSSRRFSCR